MLDQTGLRTELHFNMNNIDSELWCHDRSLIWPGETECHVMNDGEILFSHLE